MNGTTAPFEPERDALVQEWSAIDAGALELALAPMAEINSRFSGVLEELAATSVERSAMNVALRDFVPGTVLSATQAHQNQGAITA